MCVGGLTALARQSIVPIVLKEDIVRRNSTSMSPFALSLAAALLSLAACSKSKEPVKEAPKEPRRRLRRSRPRRPRKRPPRTRSKCSPGGRGKASRRPRCDDRGLQDEEPGHRGRQCGRLGRCRTNAKAILANRLQAGNPPDSYQRHAGLELSDDIKAGKVEDLTKLYETSGWKDKLPKGLLEAITIDGKIYSVPVNIHRANLIWFVPKTLQTLGLGGPPKNWKEFMTQAKTIRPRARPRSRSDRHGRRSTCSRPCCSASSARQVQRAVERQDRLEVCEVTAALDMFKQVLSVSDIKSSAADWQPAADRVIDGTAVYTVMATGSMVTGAGRRS